MNVSLNWLKEYVDLDDNISVKEIVDKMTMSGSKVETYEEFGKRTENVYTARVRNIEKHSEDKDLSILKLDIGTKVLAAVAKIPDIEIGDIVPVALPGAKVIGKEIKVSDVKGIKSECMVCHILDLGLEPNFEWCKPSGLISFPKDVEIGMDVNDILGLGDYIIEFEITPNRPDCMSVEGLANELALTFDKSCKELWQYMPTNFNVVDNINEFKVAVESDNCKRYSAGMIENVKIAPSPYDMQLKLIKCGIRPINNMVDITNFVMLELGSPLHAFDKEKLNSNEIVVRQAKEGEVLTTLDDIKRDLLNTDLVITDGKTPVAIAGVMGGEISGINENTNDVILESANFARAAIRNTSKRFALRTDASNLYEKGLPQELTLHAVNRVFDLVRKQNCGSVSNNIIDIYPSKQIQKEIPIDYDRINSIVGINISKEEIESILTKVLIKVEDSVAYIPYTREDIEITEDLSEEVARIYGYDKLDSSLPNTKTTFGVKTYEQKLEDSIKNQAMASGYNEIYTYTFFNKDLLDRMNVSQASSLRDCIKIKNPLSEDFEYMRTTAMPLMLEALERNYTKKNLQVKLFELGKIFFDKESVEKKELGKEEMVLTLGMYDDKSDYYDFKEVVERILNYFSILEYDYSIERIEENPIYHPGISAKILIDGNIVAEFGKLSPKVTQNYILPDNTYIGTIYFENIIKYAKKDIKFIELPKYPAVERDIAFVINENVLAYDIERKIKTIKYIENIKLFDVYKGKQIEEGKKSMAYSLFLRSREKTLEENDIETTMKEVYNIIENEFKAELRK